MSGARGVPRRKGMSASISTSEGRGRGLPVKQIWQATSSARLINVQAVQLQSETRAPSSGANGDCPGAGEILLLCGVLDREPEPEAVEAAENTLSTEWAARERLREGCGVSGSPDPAAPAAAADEDEEDNEDDEDDEEEDEDEDEAGAAKAASSIIAADDGHVAGERARGPAAR